MTAQATFYVVTAGNDVYWRVQSPAKILGANVVEIPGANAQEILTKPHGEGLFPWEAEYDDEGAIFRHPEHEGTAVWVRPDQVRAQHALSMEHLGIRTLAEVDDNYLSEMHLNLFMRENKYGPKAQQAHLNAMGSFQGVVFSTDWLRDRYAKAFKKHGHEPELFVCRNHANLDDWPDPIYSSRLRVGWMGSAQHARDIKLVADAMAWARGQAYEVVHMGHDPRSSEGVTNPAALDACLAWSAIISTQIPWVDPELYHRQALPIDIGLAPLERNDHTLGKSDIKWLEYTMSGAATIASSGTVYDEIEHGETGILAGSPDEFTYWTQRLCKDRPFREYLAQNAEAYIRARRTMQVQGKQEWEAAIRG